MSGIKQAIAIFDGFVGYQGQAQHLIGNSVWPADHPFVQANPQHFRFPDGGAPAEQKSGEVDKQNEEELPPYTEWLLADLQAEAKDRGLPTSGTKADLAQRLEDWDASNPDE